MTQVQPAMSSAGRTGARPWGGSLRQRPATPPVPGVDFGPAEIPSGLASGRPRAGAPRTGRLQDLRLVGQSLPRPAPTARAGAPSALPPELAELGRRRVRLGVWAAGAVAAGWLAVVVTIMAAPWLLNGEGPRPTAAGVLLVLAPAGLAVVTLAVWRRRAAARLDPLASAVAEQVAAEAAALAEPEAEPPEQAEAGWTGPAGVPAAGWSR
jgi:hypothetical protein